jgi:hypothetical protein
MKKYLGLTGGVCGLLVAPLAFAAADADLTNSVTAWTATVKENAIAIAAIIIPAMIIVFLTFWGARKALSMIGGRR